MNWEVITNLCGIVVNAILAVWIVNTLQKRQNNERFIKEHFIQEVKGLREDLKRQMNLLYLGRMKKAESVTRMKLVGIKAANIVNILQNCFFLDCSDLNNHLVNLNRVITDDEHFIHGTDENLRLTIGSKRKLLELQESFYNSFNNYIIQVNSANYHSVH